jgi:hypothetical protein
MAFVDEHAGAVDVVAEVFDEVDGVEDGAAGEGCYGVLRVVEGVEDEGEPE